MAVKFPFERGRQYCLDELRRFETELLDLRRTDREFTNELRVPSNSREWMALRQKELNALRLYADHANFVDTDTFEIFPEGSQVDAALVRNASERTLLQITLAFPVWHLEGEEIPNSGYQYHQMLRAINDSQIVSGYPPYEMEDGVSIGAIQALTNDERDRACVSGLEQALNNKNAFDGSGVTLAVFAQDFYLQLLDVKLLRNLVDQALAKFPTTFDSVAVFDSHPGFFVEIAGIHK